MTIAYLDPGSGSLIISAVVGGAAGAAVAVRHARARVTGVFKRKGKQTDAVSEAPDSAAEPTASPQAAPPATSAEAVAPGESA
ncbi:MAG: hypothetical protein ACRD0V_16665 [Acidimicrobiales bacterium]